MEERLSAHLDASAGVKDGETRNGRGQEDRDWREEKTKTADRRCSVSFLFLCFRRAIKQPQGNDNKRGACSFRRGDSLQCREKSSVFEPTKSLSRCFIVLIEIFPEMQLYMYFPEYFFLAFLHLVINYYFKLYTLAFVVQRYHIYVVHFKIPYYPRHMSIVSHFTSN